MLEKITYKAQTTSLTSEVQRLKAANADVLLPSSYTSDTFLLLRTAKELDYNPKLIVAQNAGFTDPTFITHHGQGRGGRHHALALQLAIWPAASRCSPRSTRSSRSTRTAAICRTCRRARSPA